MLSDSQIIDQWENKFLPLQYEARGQCRGAFRRPQRVLSVFHYHHKKIATSSSHQFAGQQVEYGNANNHLYSSELLCKDDMDKAMQNRCTSVAKPMPRHRAPGKLSALAHRLREGAVRDLNGTSRSERGNKKSGKISPIPTPQACSV